ARNTATTGTAPRSRAPDSRDATTMTIPISARIVTKCSMACAEGYSEGRDVSTAGDWECVSPGRCGGGERQVPPPPDCVADRKLEADFLEALERPHPGLVDLIQRIHRGQVREREPGLLL